jgi:hypothetical protein
MGMRHDAAATDIRNVSTRRVSYKARLPPRDRVSRLFVLRTKTLTKRSRLECEAILFTAQITKPRACLIDTSPAGRVVAGNIGWDAHIHMDDGATLEHATAFFGAKCAQCGRTTAAMTTNAATANPNRTPVEGDHQQSISGRGPIGQVIARPAVEPHALPDFATRSGLRITWQGILRPGAVSGACRDLD